MTTGTLALLILAAILAQVAIAASIGLYRRRRQYREPGERRVPPIGVSAAPTAHSPVLESSFPSGAWTGFREFSVQRREFEDSGRSVCSFYLVPSDGEPLPPFKPGQFLTFRLAVKHPVTAEPSTVVRCYSLSDAPRPDHYRISVKRVPVPPDRPDLPPGISSGFFHDQVREGDRLMVKAPSGHFYLVEDEPLPIVLIAGGIGITPLLSMLNSVLKGEIRRDVWLYYGVRNGGEHVMKEHLRQLAGRHDNFHLHVCYSAPRESDAEGTDYHHRGRIAVPLLRHTLKLARYQFYVCGPRPMMESLIPGLAEWGVDTADIHYESFGPATLAQRPTLAATAGDAPPVSITFSRSGKHLSWDASAGSLLEFAEANAVEVESGCRAGSCGTCQTALKAGEVHYAQQPDADIEPGHCLLCIATPKSDLVLEA